MRKEKVMKLKDILELGTYGFDPDNNVKVYDMEQLEADLEQNKFSEIYIPKEKPESETFIYKYGFLVDKAILVAMVADSEKDSFKQ